MRAGCAVDRDDCICSAAVVIVHIEHAPERHIGTNELFFVAVGVAAARVCIAVRSERLTF